MTIADLLLNFRSAGVRWLPLPDQGTSWSSGVASSVSFPASRDGALLGLIHREDWFDVLDGGNRPILTEREILRNLQAIIIDANDTPLGDVS